MPWVRLDDRFPSHRKVALLSDRAFRLYVSALCWSSENLTEGKILDRELPLISRVRGAKKIATELEDAGLWDRGPGGWAIHDYLEYNPDRSRVQADREANAARQKAFRERKRAEREARQKAEEEAARNATRNAVTPDGEGGQKRTTATRTRHDGDTTAARTRPENRREPQVSGIRNGVSNGPPSPPPSPTPSPTEKEQASRTRELATTRIPDQARPLVDQLTAAGVIVRWPFTGNEWFPLLALISKTGVPAMVDHAVKVAARTSVESAKYFLNGWGELPPMPEPGTARPALRTVSAPATPQAARRQASRHVLDQLTEQLRAGGDQ